MVISCSFPFLILDGPHHKSNHIYIDINNYTYRGEVGHSPTFQNEIDSELMRKRGIQNSADKSYIWWTRFFCARHIIYTSLVSGHVGGFWLEWEDNHIRTHKNPWRSKVSVLLIEFSVTKARPWPSSTWSSLGFCMFNWAPCIAAFNYYNN